MVKKPRRKTTRKDTRHHYAQVPERPQLGPDDLDFLRAEFERQYGYPAKPFQLEAIQAQIEGRDVIVQAPTGSGKTAIAAGPHLWPANKDKFTIMVCPLLSLEEEMVCSILSLLHLALMVKTGSNFHNRFRFERSHFA